MRPGVVTNIRSGQCWRERIFARRNGHIAFLRSTVLKQIAFGLNQPEQSSMASNAKKAGAVAKAEPTESKGVHRPAAWWRRDGQW